MGTSSRIEGKVKYPLSFIPVYPSVLEFVGICSDVERHRETESEGETDTCWTSEPHAVYALFSMSPFALLVCDDTSIQAFGA